jgi:hypothetical protein
VPLGPRRGRGRPLRRQRKSESIFQGGQCYDDQRFRPGTDVVNF